jgi:hypothetical protein
MEHSIVNAEPFPQRSPSPSDLGSEGVSIDELGTTKALNDGNKKSIRCRHVKTRELAREDLLKFGVADLEEARQNNKNHQDIC